VTIAAADRPADTHSGVVDARNPFTATTSVAAAVSINTNAAA
jgi:hypothetical protein